MKKIIALALVCSTAAFAAIQNSKHDFSSGSTSGGAKSATETQACKFCHVPHGGSTTASLLWAHTNTAGLTYNWGTATKTAAGTTLPTTNAVTASAARCYACHDGTIAVGSTTINGTTNVLALSTAGNVGATGLITGTPMVKANAMAGNHPVSIPYPGSAGAYNGITSAATVADYKAITTTGCQSTSGICVAGTATTGLAISLVRDTTVTTNYGVECTSCHDPHNSANTKFLVVSNAASNLCTSCHNK